MSAVVRVFPAGEDRRPAGEGARHTAGVYLAAGMPSSWLREHGSYMAPEDRLAIADAMDELLAGGFDPAARMREIMRGAS